MQCPKWLDDAVFYEIYPQSFQDSNHDGIGDLPGIIQRLDYVKSLGANAIWLNPCFESPFQDAGYDVSDYCRVAPRYGTNDDLVQLFHEAHQRGIRVILDLVAGHTSIQHPWFQNSAQPEKNHYSNYFIWTDSWLQGDDKFRFINGFGPRNANFMINFFYCQPALNYGFRNPDPDKPWQLPMDHPDVKNVREELRNVMKFWLDRGADGFRVDMAASLVRGDNAAEGIRELWHDYRGWLDANYPDAVLVSEWSHPDIAIDAGFHIDFMVHFGEPGYTSLLRQELFRIPNSPFSGQGKSSFFDRSGNGSAKTFSAELEHHLAATAGRGFVCAPTGNHDIGRIRQGRSDAELKVALAGMLLLPGVPFLYYGDEIGMDYVEGLVSKEGGYNRTGSRTPMQWTADARNAGFSDAAPGDFYLPLDSDKNRPDVATQENNPDSLLHFVRKLIRLRRDNPALCARGAYRTLSAEDGKPWVYVRESDGRKFVIALNPAAEARSVEVAFAGADRAETVLAAPGVALHTVPGAARIDLPEASYAVFAINR